MMFAVQSSLNPEIGFAVDTPKRFYARAKELAIEGLQAWFDATNKDFKSEHFSNEDKDWIYDVGWAEPTEFLLNEHNIPANIYDCFDDEGEWRDDFPAAYVTEVEGI